MLALDLNINSIATAATPSAKGSSDLSGVEFQSMLNNDSQASTVKEAGKVLPVQEQADAFELAEAETLVTENSDVAENDIYELADENDDLSLDLYNQELTASDYQLCDDFAKVQQDLCSVMLVNNEQPAANNVVITVENGNNDGDLPSSDEFLSAGSSSLAVSDKIATNMDVDNLTLASMEKSPIAQQVGVAIAQVKDDTDAVNDAFVGDSQNSKPVSKSESSLDLADATDTALGQEDAASIEEKTQSTDISNKTAMEAAPSGLIAKDKKPGEAKQANTTENKAASAKLEVVSDKNNQNTTASKSEGLVKLQEAVANNDEVVSIKVSNKSAAHGQKLSSYADRKAEITNSFMSSDEDSSLDTLSLLNRMQNAVKNGTSVNGENSKSAEIITLARNIKNANSKNVDSIGEDNSSFDYLAEDLKLGGSDNEFGSDFTSLLNDKEQQANNVLYSVANEYTQSLKQVSSFTSASISNVETAMNVRSGEAMSTAATPDNTDTNGVFDNRVKLFEGKSDVNAENIKNKVMEMSSRNLREIELELNPHNLGKMKVRIDMDEASKASVSFMVTNSHTKEMLSSAMPKLKEFLEQAGVMLTEQNVSQDGGNQNSDGYERANSTWHDNLVKAASSSGSDWLETMNSVGSEPDLNSLPDGVRGMKIAHVEKDSVDYFA